MLYMVVEHFREGAMPAIYRRLRENGRMMPAGLIYLSSWISEDRRTCFQLMEAAERALFETWMEKWKDLMQFEIVAVRTSAEIVAEMNRQF